MTGVRLGVPAFGLVAGLLFPPGGASNAGAQLRAEVRRPATAAEVVAGNILIGGVSASARALLGRRDPWKAFGLGALGGAAHLAGKNLALEPREPKGWLGLVLAGIGSSIVANAGAGAAPLEELTLPVAMARIRVTPWGVRKVRLALNGYESVLVGSALLTDRMSLDWTRTMTTGAVVFETRRATIEADGGEVDGFAWGPVVIVDPLGVDPARTTRHEIAHAHQHWFMSEAWGRPIEEHLRARVPLRRWLPAWLDLGVAIPGLLFLERRLIGDGGTYALMQAEAQRLERR